MTDKLISQKAVLDHLNDICNRCGRFNRNNGAECGYCELCGMDEFVEELPTIPQTDSVLNEIKTELHEELYGDISYTDLERIEHIIDNHIRGKE